MGGEETTTKVRGDMNEFFEFEFEFEIKKMLNSMLYNKCVIHHSS